jgi:hypothetical protein
MDVLKKLQKVKTIIKNRKLIQSIISSNLFFLENPGKSAWGSITETDEEGIRQAVVLARNYQGPIIEVGTLFGHTTNMIASLKSPEVSLISIDNFCWNPFFLPPEAHRQFTRRTLCYVIEHCSTQIFDGSSADFYAANPTLKPSLVFIDAAHDYKSVKQDIAWAVSTGCPVISGHDYDEIHPGVVKAVDEAFGDNISCYGSVWIHHQPKLA